MILITILAKNIQFEYIYIYIKIYEKKEIIRAAKEQGWYSQILSRFASRFPRELSG